MAKQHSYSLRGLGTYILNIENFAHEEGQEMFENAWEDSKK